MESLNRYFSKITGPIFQRHGFANLDLVTRWAEIAGQDIGAVSLPEQIKWPRKKSAERAGQRLAGTLILRVTPGNALVMQHKIPLILDRINVFFGYQAITHITLRQGALPARAHDEAATAPPLSPQTQDKITRQVGGIEDPNLRASLNRLGNAAAARRLQRKAVLPR